MRQEEANERRAVKNQVEKYREVDRKLKEWKNMKEFTTRSMCKKK